MNTLKKIISSLMCLILITSAVGCKKASGNDSQEFELKSGPYYTYSATPLEYESPEGTNTNYGVFWGDSIIVTLNVNYTIEQEMASMKWDSNKTPLPIDENGDYCVPVENILIYDYDCNLRKVISLADYAGQFITTPVVCVDSKNNTHVVITRPLDNKIGEYEYVYLIVDAEGELVNSCILPLTSSNSVYGIAYSESDGLVLMIAENIGYDWNNYYVVIDESGNEINRVIQPEGFFFNFNLYTYKDRVYACVNDFQTGQLYFTSIESLLEGNNDSYYSLTGIPAEEDRYWQNNNGLIYKSYEDGAYYLLNPEDSTSALITDMNINDIGIYPSYGHLRSDSSFVTVGNNGLDSKQWAATITSCDTDVNADKSVIVVAGIGINEDPIANYMKFSFNSSHSDYKIEFVDYRDTYGYDYSDEELGMIIAEDLMYQRLSGDSPDIILDVTGTFPFYTISNDEYLVDTYSYYNEALNSIDYNTGIIEDSKIDGHLYSIPLAYSVKGFITNEDNYNRAEGWSIGEFREIADSFDGQMIPNLASEDLLINQLQVSFADYFDIASKKVNFNSNSFIDLLDWAKENGDYVLDYLNGNYAYWFQDGMHYCDYDDTVHIDTLYRASSFINESIDVLGFPASEGSYLGAFPNYRLAIASDTKDAKIAWEFIMCGFEETPQNAMARLYFPISNDALDYGINYILAYGPIDSSAINLDDIHARVVNMIARINRVNQYDPEIFAIVKEEAMAYFNGDKTASEVADIIQDRCSIIMSERYG